jgi:hypothetical protein
MVEMHLQVTPAFVARIVQLHSAMQSSSAAMLVGAAGCGKTIATTVLAKALTRLATSTASNDDSIVQSSTNSTEQSAAAATEIKVVKLYPNTLTFNELYGQYDDTNECWRDGLLSTLLPSTTTAGSSSTMASQQTWLVLDADFSYTSDDTIPVAWAEALISSVTAAAAAPCISLSNLERMPLSASQQHSVKLLFESSDIHCASPAILSRCSVVKFKEAGQVSYILYHNVYNAILCTSKLCTVLSANSTSQYCLSCSNHTTLCICTLQWCFVSAKQ